MNQIQFEIHDIGGRTFEIGRWIWVCVSLSQLNFRFVWVKV